LCAADIEGGTLQKEGFPHINGRRDPARGMNLLYQGKETYVPGIPRLNDTFSNQSNTAATPSPPQYPAAPHPRAVMSENLSTNALPNTLSNPRRKMTGVFFGKTTKGVSL